MEIYQFHNKDCCKYIIEISIYCWQYIQFSTDDELPKIYDPFDGLIDKY